VKGRNVAKPCMSALRRPTDDIEEEADLRLFGTWFKSDSSLFRLLYNRVVWVCFMWRHRSESRIDIPFGGIKAKANDDELNKRRKSLK
jgi:hypothetical protein